MNTSDFKLLLAIAAGAGLAAHFQVKAQNAVGEFYSGDAVGQLGKRESFHGRAILGGGDSDLEAGVRRLKACVLSVSTEPIDKFGQYYYPAATALGAATFFLVLSQVL